MVSFQGMLQQKFDIHLNACMNNCYLRCFDSFSEAIPIFFNGLKSDLLVIDYELKYVKCSFFMTAINKKY